MLPDHPGRGYTRLQVSDIGDSPDEPPEQVDGELVPEDEAPVVEVRRLPLAEHDASVLDRPRERIGSVPVTVVAATGGFLLGVASFVLMRVLRRPGTARSLARRRGRLAARRRGVDVESTRSFLVDVHLLKR